MVKPEVASLLDSPDPEVKRQAAEWILAQVKESVSVDSQEESTDTPDDQSHQTDYESLSATQSQDDDMDAVPWNTSSCSSKSLEPLTGKVWQAGEVKSFVDIRFGMNDKFCGTTNHKTLWRKVVAEMQALGFEVTVDQCENKFKSLKRTYKSVIDHNKQTGNDPKDWKYLEQFNSIYGCKDSTNPKYTIGSLGEK